MFPKIPTDKDMADKEKTHSSHNGQAPPHPVALSANKGDWRHGLPDTASTRGRLRESNGVANEDDGVANGADYICNARDNGNEDVVMLDMVRGHTSRTKVRDVSENTSEIVEIDPKGLNCEGNKEGRSKNKEITHTKSSDCDFIPFNSKGVNEGAGKGRRRRYSPY